MEGRVVDVQIEEPLEEHVVLKLITEAACAANGEKRHQELRLEQVLRRNRGTAHARIDVFKDRRQLCKRPVHDRFDPADRVVHRHQLLGRRRCHHHLRDRLATHSSLPALNTVSTEERDCNALVFQHPVSG